MDDNKIITEKESETTAQEKTIESIMEKASEEIMQIVEEKLPMLKDDDEFITEMPAEPEPEPIPEAPSRDYKHLLEEYLEECQRQFSSDLHLKVNNKPCVRLSKELIPISDELLDEETVMGIIKTVLTPKKQQVLAAEKEVDFSFGIGEERYRANAFTDMNGSSLSIRRYNADFGDFESLGLPLILRDLSLRKNGMILLTGPTGSGKSTTLAAIINYLNNTVSEHIITLEDPIEFIHKSNKCIISQREVGRDTMTFAKGLRSCLRQDPDVIMLGEMRDIESISTALTAAETGHLVLATLHTTGAENAVDRIIDSFPAGQQDQIRTQLAMVLLCVVSQQLVPRAKGDGRVLATEVLISNSAVKSLIRQGKNFQLQNTMQTSRNAGMYTLNQSLEELCKKGAISNESFNIYQTNINSVTNKNQY